jgi:hypothetical protein
MMDGGWWQDVSVLFFNPGLQLRMTARVEQSTIYHPLNC